MPDQNLPFLYRQNERLFIVVNHLIMTLMLSCVVITIVQFTEYVAASWSGTYLVGFCFLVTLETIYSQRRMKKLRITGQELFFYRTTEIVAILILLKLVLYIVRDFSLLWQDIPLWRENFFVHFFTLEYLLAAVVVVLTWVMAALLADELLQLEGDEQLLKFEAESGFYQQRPAARRNLAYLILVLGIIMVVMVAFMRLDWQSLGIGLPTFNAWIVNILIYFVLSLVLLSLTQFSILRVHWSLERIPVSPDLAKRWTIYAATSLLLIVVFASLLPTRYSVGLLEILGFFLAIVLQVLQMVIVLLSIPLILLMNLLGRLFGGQTDRSLPALAPPALMPPPEQAPGALGEILKSLIFWVLFLGVVLYSLYYFIQQRKELAQGLNRIPLLNVLGRAWRGFWSWLRGVNRNIVGAVDAGIRRLRTRAQAEISRQAWRYVNPRHLSPRLRVIFFYLALVRRAGEQGLARRPAQTPYEYSTILSKTLPEVDEDIAEMTSSFMEARYSQHEITAQKAGLVQRYWEHIRRVFRKTVRREEQ